MESILIQAIPELIAGVIVLAISVGGAFFIGQRRGTIKAITNLGNDFTQFKRTMYGRLDAVEDSAQDNKECLAEIGRLIHNNETDVVRRQRLETILRLTVGQGAD